MTRPKQRLTLPRTVRTTTPRSRATSLVGGIVTSTVLALLAGLLVVAGSAAPAQADWYKPPVGITVNDPLGSKREKRAINRHVRRSIDSVMRRQKIRIASWNLRNDTIVDSLVAAHKRGVSVRVVVDRGNANPDNPNPGVDRLRRVLSRHGNATRKPAMRSGVRRCVSACRGQRGIAHSKFFLFSQVGPTRWVVVNGSANLTDLAASHQWNDVFTTRGRRNVYDEFLRVFDQMYADRTRAQGYRVRQFQGLTTMFMPWTGSGTAGDPTMRELDRVRCWGATNTGDRRTRLKIAMTSWHGERGVRLARKVRRLYDGGCQVQIIYAVMGNEVLRLMRNGRRGPIPFRQLVQDPDGDGVYDRYLHTKVLTIRGRYAGQRGAFVTVNGSLNWTPVALASDEAVMRLRGKRVLEGYNRWIAAWYARAPRTRSVGSAVEGRRTTTSLRTTQVAPLGALVDGVDPYAKIQEH